MKLITDTGLNQTQWDAGLITHLDGHFLQSWAWGEFQQSIGHKIWRLGVEHDGSLLLQLLVIKQSLGAGQHILYSPRGNLATKNSSALDVQAGAKLILDKVREIALQEGCIFFRLDPPVAATDIATIAWYKQLGFYTNPHKPIQPQHNQVLNISQGADKALSQSKPKARYNISVAKRHNLVVTHRTDETAIQAFLSLHSQTANRQGFKPHSTAYLEKQIRFLLGHNTADLVTVWHPEDRSRPLSSIFIVYFGTNAIYLHGASSSSDRALMAPYLAHDFALHLAEGRGMTTYDLGGVQPNPKHAWAGITRFKQGFGGETISYIGTLELPLVSWKYQLYRLLSKLR